MAVLSTLDDARPGVCCLMAVFLPILLGYFWYTSNWYKFITSCEDSADFGRLVRSRVLFPFIIFCNENKIQIKMKHCRRC